MKKPNIKKHTYSTGELKSPIEYIGALELYISHLEAENKQLTIQRVVNCSNCDSKNIVKEDLYRCSECNCFHTRDGAQL